MVPNGWTEGDKYEVPFEGYLIVGSFIRFRSSKSIASLFAVCFFGFDVFATEPLQPDQRSTHTHLLLHNAYVTDLALRKWTLFQILQDQGETPGSGPSFGQVASSHAFGHHIKASVNGEKKA